MKKIVFFLIMVCSIVLFSCTSSEASRGAQVPVLEADFHTLNQALDIGMEKIESDLPQGADITILDFKSVSPNLSYYIIEEMYDKLINGQKLSIIDRSRTDTIKKEIGYQLSGNVDDNQIISIGKQLGANYVVTGEITFSGEVYRLRVFAIDIEKNQRVASSSLNINSDDKQVNYLISVKNEDDILKGYLTLETVKQPVVGNVSVVTGGLQLSVLSSCLVEFEVISNEAVNLPAGGTIPVNNINPGFHRIKLLYDDYTVQEIGFIISPGEITNLNIGYVSGPKVNFPPVSTIQVINYDGIPEWYSDNSLIGYGIDNDRYEAEKMAYLDIIHNELNGMSATDRYDLDEKGNVIWEDNVTHYNINITKVAFASKIVYVSYDANRKQFHVIAEMNKSDAQKTSGGTR